MGALGEWCGETDFEQISNIAPRRRTKVRRKGRNRGKMPKGDRRKYRSAEHITSYSPTYKARSLRATALFEMSVYLILRCTSRIEPGAFIASVQATRLCPWQNNRCTTSASNPVSHTKVSRSAKIRLAEVHFVAHTVGVYALADTAEQKNAYL